MRLRAGSEADVTALAELAEQRESGVEDWETIRQLCAACSTGTPGLHDAAAPYTEGQVVELAIAARGDDELRALLDTWGAAHGASAALDVTLLVPGGAPSTS